jgi:hypothetical protein
VVVLGMPRQDLISTNKANYKEKQVSGLQCEASAGQKQAPLRKKVTRYFPFQRIAIKIVCY